MNPTPPPPWSQVFSHLFPHALYRLDPESDHWLDRANHLLSQDMQTSPRQVQLIPHPLPPLALPYEAWIKQYDTVPTRRNWHDYLNALVWLTLPQIKYALNDIQAAEIRLHGNARTPARDAATLLDENGAIMWYQDASYYTALQARLWVEVLWQERDSLLQHIRLILIGHALHDKLRHPYNAITTHVLGLKLAPEQLVLVNSFDWHSGWKNEAERARLDGYCAHYLRALYARQEFTPKIFTPLPVAGVPGWQTGQGAEFYADTRVFRPLISPLI